MREITDIDKDIRRIIQDNGNESDYLCLESDSRWEVFYHLSPMRRSILNWYEFNQNSALLEIGGGYGALTGLFCDRCQKVITLEESEFRAETIKLRYKNRKNLLVECSKVQDFTTEEKFDYIILIGILEEQNNGSSKKEEYIEFLNNIIKFLKPDGKLFIAVDNRYGLQYFCGKEDPYTKKPFSGLNGYPNSSNGYTFSRKELQDILKMSNINYYKFYYPLPDYKLTQLIYSQDYLPDTSIRDRVIPYYTNKNTLVAIEDNMIDDIIDNNVFEFFANSFLIECCLTEKFSDVIYAALSTDRGKEHGFATTIHRNNIVVKSALHEDGKKYLKKLYTNIKDLSENGIGVVKHTLLNDKIEMPFIQKKTLMAFLSDIINIDSTMFANVLDKLYNCILKSSKHVSYASNQLLQFYDNELDYGIILENAYIDMIPFNCFYYNDEFLFYDQEFVWHNFPAKYILFRAIRYTYFYISNAERILPIQYFKDKYSLENLWNIFEREEAIFVEANRNYKLYNQFYKWAGIDKQKVYQNADKLCKKEG